MARSEDSNESNDDESVDTFDYELNLLAMQFQKYQCRRLYVSDLWLLWCVQVASDAVARKS